MHEVPLLLWEVLHNLMKLGVALQVAMDQARIYQDKLRHDSLGGGRRTCVSCTLAVPHVDDSGYSVTPVRDMVVTTARILEILPLSQLTLNNLLAAPAASILTYWRVQIRRKVDLAQEVGLPCRLLCGCSRETCKVAVQDDEAPRRKSAHSRRVAITGRRYVMTHAMRSSSQPRPVINFH